MNYFLFARPSLLVGVAQIIDFGNTLFVYNESNTPSQADYMATKSDWIAVGEDLRTAVARVEQNHRQLQPNLL